jgi:hypothetical protein
VAAVRVRTDGDGPVLVHAGQALHALVSIQTKRRMSPSVS